MPSVPITIATDYTTTLPTWHNFVYSAPPAAGQITCFEVPVPVAWAPGAGLFQHKLTKSVLHRGMPCALEGHDCGYMIPHISVPMAPFNTLLPFQIMFSSRKMAVSSSKVKADGAQVACQLLTFLPMLACGDPVPLPIATSTNLLNNVQVGLTGMDMLAGALGYVLTLVTELILAKAPKVPKYDLKSLAKKFILDPSSDGITKQVVKNGVAALSGAARIHLTGDGEIRLKTGTDYFNVGSSYKKGLDGKETVSYHGTVGVPSPLAGAAAVRGRHDDRYAPGGAHSSTTSGAASAGMGGASVRRTDSTKVTDGDPSVDKKTETEVTEVGPQEGYHYRSQSNKGDSSGKPGTSAYEGGHRLGRPWGQPL